MTGSSKKHAVWPGITIGIVLLIIFMAGYLVLRKTGAISVIMDKYIQAGVLVNHEAELAPRVGE